jgi:hypothetical protein
MIENYRQDKLLTENQQERMKQDLTAYQEQPRQAQVRQQKQRSPRIGGLVAELLPSSSAHLGQMELFC